MEFDYIPSFLNGDSDAVRELRAGISELKAQLAVTPDRVVKTNRFTGTQTRKDQRGHTYKVTKAEAAQEISDRNNLEATIESSEAELFNLLLEEAHMAEIESARSEGFIAGQADKGHRINRALDHMAPELASQITDKALMALRSKRNAAARIQKANLEIQVADEILSDAAELGYDGRQA